MAVVSLTQNALQALRRGQSYFRVRESYNDQDSYNCDVSLAAIAIGPDSDVDSIGITYPDHGVAGFTRTAQIGVGAPWVSRLDARMDLTLPDGTTPARINLGVGAYERRVTAAYLTPLLDLICYFTPPPAFPIHRAPKWTSSKLFTTAGVGVAEQTVFTQAYMGRKRCTLTLYNSDAVKTLTAWRFIGINMGGVGGVDTEHNISPASGSTNTLAALASASYVLTDARFDAIRLVVTPSAVSTPIYYAWEISDS